MHNCTFYTIEFIINHKIGLQILCQYASIEFHSKPLISRTYLYDWIIFYTINGMNYRSCKYIVALKSNEVLWNSFECHSVQWINGTPFNTTEFLILIIKMNSMASIIDANECHSITLNSI